MKDIFNCVMIYVGTVIGAGFASGKEIQEFFGHKLGAFHIILAFLIFLFINVRLFAYIYDNKISDYNTLLSKTCPKQKIFFNIFSMIYSLLSYGIMCSGADSALKEFGLCCGGLFFSALCIFVFCFEIKGLSFVNLILTPIIILGILLIGARKITVFTGEEVLYFADTIKYCSYNVFSCLPVIPSFYYFFSSRKKAYLSAILSSAVIFVLMLTIYFTIRGNISSLPMLKSASAVNLKWLYGLILLMSMFTTAVSNGYAYLSCIDKHKYMNMAVLFVVSLIMINIDFGTLIKYVFGAFGVVSFFLVYFLIKNS